jgi:peptidoglycan/xylan/chitin deacetylase (PgdA/CDA1 family)
MARSCFAAHFKPEGAEPRQLRIHSGTAKYFIKVKMTRLRLTVLLCNAAIALALFSGFQSCAQRIAFTWDDLPSHSALPPGETRVGIGRKIIAAMKQAKMPPAYGFVNGIRTEEEPLSTPMLKEWRDAGLPLGNHTWSHMNLNQRSLGDWEADVVKNEPLLRSYMGDRDWHWLRFPYLAEGNSAEKRDAARKFLAERGYRIAAVTMSFADYAYNEPYARCVVKGDTAGIAQLEAAYLNAADASLSNTRAISRALYGRDIPYVLLMHVGALDARLLPRLLQLYRERGVTFISLEEAEKDPFYKNDLDLSLPAIPDTLEQATQARGIGPPGRPHVESDLNAICR